MYMYRCIICVHALPYGGRVEGEHADNNLKELLMKTFFLSTSTCLNYLHTMDVHIQGQYFQHLLQTGQSPFIVLRDCF